MLVDDYRRLKSQIYLPRERSTKENHMFNDGVMQKKRECKAATKFPTELYNLEVLIEGTNSAVKRIVK